MMMHGKPDYHEVKYHMEWWGWVGLISNVLSRRGVRSKNVREKLVAFGARNDPSISKTTFKDSVIRQRLKKNREKK